MSMNITFLIGNGFDINLGLATTYSQFVKSYCKIQDQDSLIIQYFKRHIIKPNLPLWSNAELAFGKHTELIPDSFTVEAFCNCHSDFCISLAKYLTQEQKKLVLNQDNNRIIGESFSKAINNPTKGFRTVPKNNIQSAISSNTDIVFNFIDFNYTDTLDRICSTTDIAYGWGKNGHYLNRMGKIIHAHGTVDKDMVLGVHDETQIANSACFQAYDEYYLAQLIKSRTDSINEENTYQQALHMLNVSDLIYIYGMSLGETDKFWWEKICGLLKDRKALRVIIHSFGAPTGDLLSAERKRHEDAQRNKLFDLGNVNEDQRSAVQSRVHVTGANIFSELSNITNQPLVKGQSLTDEIIAV